MNWAWVNSLEQIWRSPSFPMWLTLAAAGFFGLIVLVTLLRAEKSVANGALTVITLVAIAVAGAATIRSYGSAGQGPAASGASAAPASSASLPALACLDELAGDTVLAACEKVVFGSADAVAAAVSATAGKISRLASYGDVIAANRTLTPELMALRRAVERDRYGLIAYVLQTRDRCQTGSCPFYASLTDHNQIAANMEERTYEALVAHYAPVWNTPPATVPASATGTLAGLPPSVPTGKPTTADFPTSASIPPINIMTPEPAPTAARPPAPRAPAAANAQEPRPAATAAAAAANPAPAVPKKPAAPKPPRPQAQAPVSLAPAAADPDN